MFFLRKWRHDPGPALMPFPNWSAAVVKMRSNLTLIVVLLCTGMKMKMKMKMKS